MSDDIERRLRDALGGANLPGAPETLRASMRAIADSPAALPPRRMWVRALPTIAAVVVMAAVAATLSGGFGTFNTPVSSASPSGLWSAAPSEPPTGTTQAPATQRSSAAPPTSISVVDGAGLRAELDAIKAGTAAAHDVVADVSVDASQVPSPRTMECQLPLGTCTVIGVLAGTNQTVTVRREDGVLLPPITSDGLKAPLALRLVPGGPIELLGHVDLAPPAGYLDTAGLKQLTTTAAPDRVVAVLAWLSSVNGMSCGPMRPSDVPAPFACPGDPSFLNDQPVLSAVIDDHPSPEPGSSTTPTRVVTGSVPDSAVLVQAFAYNRYAPSPSISDGVNGDPRRAMYLVRMVAVDNADCPRCRGWLIVGRLDAQPPTASASDQPNAGQRVYSAAELETVLTANRALLVGKPVLVDGRIDTSIVSTCHPDPASCPIGRLADTTEVVSATQYTGQLLEGGAGLDAQSVMAMVVRESGLEYLGSMGYGGQGVDFQAPVSQLAGDFSANPPLLAFIVSGWLGTSGPLPCPSVPGSPPPADTPFGSSCPSSWLAATDQQKGYAMPAGSVVIQFGAYQDFAPGTRELGGPPKFGTYLVRLVTDTRQGIDGPRGWQVVARLAP